MSTAILIEGESGTGKSTSMRNLSPTDTVIINCIGKEFPFRSNFKILDKETKTGNIVSIIDPKKICKIMTFVSEEMPHIKILIVDDFQYTMSYEFMNRSTESGWDKFTEIGRKAFDILKLSRELRSDLIVIILTHSYLNTDGGKPKVSMKTIGRMLDEKITPEGMFTIVLLTKVIIGLRENTYVFETQTDGYTPAKSPIDMFKEKQIPNDLKVIIDTINQFYKGEINNGNTING